MISTGSLVDDIALLVSNPIVSKRQDWDSLSQINRFLKHRIWAKCFLGMSDIQG